MIITCPSCSARYPVDAASFAPSGRKVRCAKCGNSWHQSPPADLQEDEAPEAAAAVPPIAAPGRKKIFGEKPASAGTAVPPVTALDDDVVFADETTPAAPKSGRTAADIGNRFRAEIRRAATMRRGKALTAAGWIVLALFVGAIAGTGYFYRGNIVALWPATTKVYAALGEPVNLRGLEFRNVSYERQTEEGLPVLAVKGEVVNVSGERVTLPRLRVGLLDEKQKELYHWTFAVSETQLTPNEVAPFITRLSSPPPEARDIEVRFVQNSEAPVIEEKPAVGEPAEEESELPATVPDAAPDDAAPADTE